MKHSEKTRKKQLVIPPRKDPINDDLPDVVANPAEMTMSFARSILPENLKHLDKLNPREFKFVAAYCAYNFDAIKAAELAGYACRTSAKYKAIAYSLLHRPEIVEAIKIYINTIIEPYKDRLELETLDIYYRRATFRVDYFFNNDGSPKLLNEIPDEWKVCIDGVEEKFSRNIRYKIYHLPNRDTALQALYRFITGLDPLASDNSLLPDEAKQKMALLYQNYQKSLTININPVDIKKKKPLSIKE